MLFSLLWFFAFQNLLKNTQYLYSINFIILIINNYKGANILCKKVESQMPLSFPYDTRLKADIKKDLVPFQIKFQLLDSFLSCFTSWSTPFPRNVMVIITTRLTARGKITQKLPITSPGLHTPGKSSPCSDRSKNCQKDQNYVTLRQKIQY